MKHCGSTAAYESKKQSMVAKSSVEAEIIGVGLVVDKSLRVLRVLSFIAFRLPRTLELSVMI